jgi:quercetin dioxygenase-like cupin family protein
MDTRVPSTALADAWIQVDPLRGRQRRFSRLTRRPRRTEPIQEVAMAADAYYSTGASTAPGPRRRSINVPATVVAAAVWLLAAPGGTAQAAVPDASSLRWSVATLLPPGALYAVVRGDPTAPGECTLQISMPNGYRFPPHSHPSDEHVVVKVGTLLVGMGDRIDAKQTRALAVGDSSTAPAGMHHFSIAKGRTILLVTFIGPYTITYVHAEDAPQPRAFPFGY